MGSPEQERCGKSPIYWSPVKGHKDEEGKSSEHASFERKLRELELLSLQKRSLRGILSICRNVIGSGRKEW